MGQNYNKNLTPYHIFQLEKYGDILPTSSCEDEISEEENLSTAELNYIFNLENSAL